MALCGCHTKDSLILFVLVLWVHAPLKKKLYYERQSIKSSNQHGSSTPVKLWRDINPVVKKYFNRLHIVNSSCTNESIKIWLCTVHWVSFIKQVFNQLYVPTFDSVT